MVNIRWPLSRDHEFFCILYFLVLFFENNDCKKISEHFGPTFLYSLNELNEFQRYVLCSIIIRYHAEKLTPLSQLGKWIFMSLSRPPNDNLFSTILYIQHPAHFPGQKRSIFSCWFQLAFCSVQLALGEFEQSSKDLFYVPYPREVGIFYHIWVGAKNLWNMIERNSYR